MDARTDHAADRAGDHLSEAEDNIDATAAKTGAPISNGADKAAGATGNLFEKTRKKLKD